MTESNRAASILAAIASLLGAVSLVVFFGDPFDGKFLFGAIGGGAVGALIGFTAGRAGANVWNRIGLWVGLLTAIASVVVLLGLTPGEMTTTEITAAEG